MPKELIDASGFDIELGWGRGMQSVTIGTLLKPQNTADEPADLPGMIAAAPDGWAGARGLFTSLDDRAKVNDLIRLLKRARDAAFGKDE